jgi:hypothetical protein
MERKIGLLNINHNITIDTADRAYVKSNVLAFNHPCLNPENAVYTIASIDNLLSYRRGELRREANLPTVATAII